MGEVGILVRLAIPVALAQLGMMSMGLVDLWMVGRLGKDSLGGVALGDLWAFGTTAIGMGIVMGLDPIVSQAHGAGDGERAGRALQRGVVVACLLGGVIWYLFGFAAQVTVLFDQEPHLAEIGGRYCAVQGWSIPAFLVFVALRQYLQGRGMMRPTLWTILIANVFNYATNKVLIFGHLGFEPMGIEGAGIATGLSRIVMLVILIAWILKFRLHRGAWAPVRLATFHLRGFGEILRYGIPVGFQIGAEVWAFQAASLFAGRLGVEALAAHTITLKIASTSFMIPLGIGAAAATRVGNLVGEGDLPRSRLAAWTAIRLGAAVMFISGLTFALMREKLGRAFSEDPEVLALIASALPVAAAFQIFDGIQVSAAGALRGAGRTMVTGIAFIVGFYVIALPASYMLSRHYGLAGIWWGLCLGLMLVAGVLCTDLWLSQKRALQGEMRKSRVEDGSDR